MSDSASIGPKPAMACIRLDGEPWIEGRRCTRCDARTSTAALACPACGVRDASEGYRAPLTGRLHAYSIVRRSYPGVPVPFVSAIVDLDDGLTLKGNLNGVDPDPEAIETGMPVRVTFGDALGRKDDEGASYIAYFFEPAQGGRA